MLTLYLENAYGMSGLTSASWHRITRRFQMTSEIQMTSENRDVLGKVLVNSQIREVSLEIQLTVL